MGEFSFDAMLAGAVGAAIFEVLRWVGLKRRRRLPIYFYKLHYWLITLLQILAGAATAGFLDPGFKSAFLVGLAGPALISRLGSLALEKLHLSAGGEPDQADVSEWFRG